MKIELDLDDETVRWMNEGVKQGGFSTLNECLLDAIKEYAACCKGQCVLDDAGNVIGSADEIEAEAAEIVGISRELQPGIRDEVYWLREEMKVRDLLRESLKASKR